MQNKEARYFGHLTQFVKSPKVLALGFSFFLLGYFFGSWATFIPYIKSKHHLSDRDLGFLLLSLQIGAMFFNPVAAWLIRYAGMHRSTLLGMCFVPLAFNLPIQMTTVWMVAVGLCITGMSISLINVAMNTCGSAIEQRDGINVMSSLHGVFSLGLMLGSLTASIAYGKNLDPRVYFFIFTIVALLGVSISYAKIKLIEMPSLELSSLQYTNTIKRSSYMGALVIMIVLSLCSNITEGCMADWAAVYMQDIVKAPLINVGWGLSAYSMFMALGRFSGDGLLPKYGPIKLLVLGSILCGMGFLISIIFPIVIFTLIGFSMIGFGVSFSAPILYANASRIPGYENGKGLAIMNTFAMAGFLGGPVIIGMLSNLYNLRLAFCLMIGVAVIWVAVANRLKIY